MLEETAVREDVAESPVNPEAIAPGLAEETAGEEADPQGTPKSGGSEPETPDQKTKRLGGWQRKILKAETERDFWREEALRTRSQEKPAEVKVVPNEAPVKPKADDFKSFEEFDAARDKYFEDLAKHEAKSAVAAAEQAAHKKTAEETAQTEWTAKVNQAKEKHTDYEEVATVGFNAILKNRSAALDRVAGLINESPASCELLYHFGQHPEEVERLAKLSPYSASKELGKIEDSVIASQSPDAEESAPTSKAPKPPSLVRKASAPADDGELRDDLPAEEWGRRFRKKLEKR